MKTLPMLLALALAAAAGCATQATRDARLGPTFSEAEKALMTDDEKLAIYNAQVRDENKLVCEMETVAGSHRLQKVCQTEKEREWNRASAHEALRDSRHFQNCLGTAQGCTGVTASP